MANWRAIIREFFNPPIPDDIRDEYLLLSAGQLQAQSRLLFLAFMITSPMAAFAAAPDAGLWISKVVPAAMTLFCLLGYLNLRRDLRLSVSPRRAARFLRESTFASCMVAVMCSAWCVHSWLGAPEHERIYYPVIIALGAFSTAYCLSSARLGAILNLAINLIPMSVLLFTSGNRMDLAVGVCLGVAALFQLHMIHKHQKGIVHLLSLQRKTRDLALSDPLTGLLNRRALLDTALELGAQGPVRLLLIDIDHFKAINDGHGHDKGDEVLCEVAERLAIRAEISACVARIGGEEFAILGLAEDLGEGFALAVLNDIRTAAMPHGGQVTVSIGLVEGAANSEPAWRELYRRADAALYEAKQNGRNRAVHHPLTSGPTAAYESRSAA